MNKANSYGVKCILLTIMCIMCLTEIKLYIQAAKLPVLNELQEDTVECTEGDEKNTVFDSMKTKEAAVDSLRTAEMPKTDNTAINSESVEVCQEKNTLESKSIGEDLVKEKSVSALDSNVQERKSDVHTMENTISIPNAELSDILHVDSASMLQTAPVTDRHKSSSFALEEAKELVHSDPEVGTAKKVYQNMSELLEDMDNAAKLAYNIFLEDKNKLRNIKKEYKDTLSVADSYIIEGKLLDNIIYDYYNHNNTKEIKINSEEDKDFDIYIENVNYLSSEIQKLEEIQKKEKNIYSKDLVFMEKLKESKEERDSSRDDFLSYYSHLIGIEKQLLSVIGYTSKIYRNIYDKEKYLCLIRGKEIEYLKNNAEEKERESEEKIKQIEELIELYKKYMLWVNKMTNMLDVMHSIQDDVLSQTTKVYNAYKEYDEEKGMLERKKIAEGI
ncbi:uncharacterized protein NESG_01914 [Nematocida ausubeli]|uniref:Uncharacterized protein n=1 Tax=Nematocida ausubeli (strain ATCC PRA-371 / ERTm2) TaxID=1913371 RepID=A0A086J1A7_NEMA1|nr:uncharacterized protein NESG_01914 [Nematocida ausubeli]KAI5132707.1 hypothetical protein NEAUS06_0303 [Nematocida ausubeli]KAI5135760.1 hypothetical protein NEAUS07_1327 [Nematocida ausubeli]KAI5146624.1 hypothetical protein NEAUS05_0069 [Nematocida ausubeli]KFG25925.1 hypothetical protein NESG_01914 [Nematocida ausubeli]